MTHCLNYNDFYGVCRRQTPLLLRLQTMVLLFGIASAELHEYCWEKFTPSCTESSTTGSVLGPTSASGNDVMTSGKQHPPFLSSLSSSTSPLLTEERVILMRQAFYGRMRQNRCLERHYFIGCNRSVVDILDRKCSGRSSCSVEIPDTDMHKLQPCPKDLLAYLEADYECVNVFKAADVTMCHAPLAVELSSNHGFLIDHVGGSSTCAFIIKAQSGQRINVTLIDFDAHPVEPGKNKMADERENFPRHSSSCSHAIYGSVHDVDKRLGSDWSSRQRETEVLLCGGGEAREKFVYMSRSRGILVVLNNNNNNNRNNNNNFKNFNKVTDSVEMSSENMSSRPRFVVSFQAVGCPDPQPPQGGWMDRSGDKVSIYCNNSKVVRHLVCNGNTWIGSYHNCSSYVEPISGDSMAQAVNSYPIGIFVAVTIGIALGVFSGLLLLSLVICFQKKTNFNQRTQKPYDVTPNVAEIATNVVDQRGKTHILLADKFYYDVASSLTDQVTANMCSCAIGSNSNIGPPIAIGYEDCNGQTHLTSSDSLLAEIPRLSYRDAKLQQQLQPITNRYATADMRSPLISILQASRDVKSDVLIGCEVVNDVNNVIIDCKPYGRIPGSCNNNTFIVSGGSK